MTDDPALLALLDVQAHDTRLDQLHHLHETLPARIERDAAAAAVAEVEAQLAAETAQRDDLARQQKRVDDEVELLKEKRSGFDAKLYGGTVTSPGELQDLQKEIDALSRRISALEDDEIEIMEQVEPVEAHLGELQSSAEQRRAALADAELRLTAAEAEVLSQIDAETASRQAAVEPVPAELLAEYTSLRGGRGGIGVARLTGSQCGACHLTLSAMEVARMRKLADGEVGHCDECGRILVP
jgi:predicted  nucleic acid-binding Zn-ribbon protein